MSYRLELRGIVKRYGATLANDDVSLGVMPGEIHAVLGENGAGKSTLMKIASGAARPDRGRILWDGREVGLPSPEAARRLGIAMVAQHFALFDRLSVLDNLRLGLPASFSTADVRAALRDAGGRHGFDVDPDVPVSGLSIGERQQVEILRALILSPRLLILDEPTSVLAPQAAERLFDALRALARDGCGVLYVTHKLDEVRALCDRCTVLRAGRVAGEAAAAEAAPDLLARMMLGHAPDVTVRTSPPAATGAGTPALRVAGLDLPPGRDDRLGLSAVGVEVGRGEIVGIAGVSGNGQQALVAALWGERDAPAGAIQLFGEPVGRGGPAARRALGARLIPEDRRGRGAVAELSLARNLLLSRTEPAFVRGGWIRAAALRGKARDILARFGVRGGGPDAPPGVLSGGNLQKFLVGREIDAAPRLLIAEQPTWGLDVAATADVRRRLAELRDGGCGVLLLSEDLDELLQLSDRVAVIAGGRLSPCVPVADATRERLARWMGGSWEEGNDVAH